ncbi:adenosine deaminase [Gammaproteobacteria bacterium]|nr:adenosine deaminase [Gammaproteobacteria bacterium]
MQAWRMDISPLPKAELHVHLEGTLRRDTAEKLAARNGLQIPGDIYRDDGYIPWQDFSQFLADYDRLAALIQSGDDYRDVTYDYLAASAEEGVIYSELIVSSDHARLSGIRYQDFVDGIVRGIDDARRDHGIEARMIMSFVRHFGLDACRRVRDELRHQRHPYMVGVTIAGDERALSFGDFRPLVDAVRADGIGITPHAGEVCGAESVWSALQELQPQRLGHGVRAIEDPALVAHLAEQGIVLEVSPSSNVRIGIFGNWASHPLPALLAAGVRCTLNSDDPPFFATTIGEEYRRAQAAWSLDEATLVGFTETAIDAAFCDDQLKQQLRERIG